MAKIQVSEILHVVVDGASEMGETVPARTSAWAGTGFRFWG